MPADRAQGPEIPDMRARDFGEVKRRGKRVQSRAVEGFWASDLGTRVSDSLNALNPKLLNS